MVYVAVLVSCTRLHLDDMTAFVGIIHSYPLARSSVRIRRWVMAALSLDPPAIESDR